MQPKNESSSEVCLSLSPFFHRRLKKFLRNPRCPPFLQCCPLIRPSRCRSVSPHSLLVIKFAVARFTCHGGRTQPKAPQHPQAFYCRRGHISRPRTLNELVSNTHNTNPRRQRAGCSFGVVVHGFRSGVSRLKKSRPRLLPLPMAGVALEAATNHSPLGSFRTQCSGVPKPLGEPLPPLLPGGVVRRSV